MRAIKKVIISGFIRFPAVITAAVTRTRTAPDIILVFIFLPLKVLDSAETAVAAAVIVYRALKLRGGEIRPQYI